jgi:hypothetical protein
VATPGKLQNSFKVFGAKPLEDVVRLFFKILPLVIMLHWSFMNEIYGTCRMQERNEKGFQNFCRELETTT